MQSRSHPALRVAVLAMMTALVFVVNYPRVIIPLSTGQTSFTLANIMCCLSGLLLGPIGGLAAGLGSALYDLTNPLYAPECWLTFLTKGAMGLGAGLVMLRAKHREEPRYPRCLLGALLGCAVYYVLYFSKSLFYDGMLVGGLSLEASALLLPLKVPASVVNAVLAVAAAPVLCLVIRSALKRAHLKLA
ncbi:ECF transporter S component [uncultured Flavonifractor sp.]|uniref:ECF transporter S component n=1 Tax=uncultured Flavonifractor sp. TaxID=1193534 RepID=UPI002607BE6F|nr:ECF transporter S component [uncultured Flavonifractor sp.]